MDEIRKRAKKLLEIGNSQAKYWIEKALASEILDNTKKTLNVLGHISEDNSLMHLIIGQLEISEATINSFLIDMPEENLRNLHIRVDSNVLWVIGETEFGNSPVIVEIPLEFMGFEFNANAKKTYFRIKEFPNMATPQTLRGGLTKLAAVVAKSFLGEENLYEKFIADIEGVCVSGKDVTVDLSLIPNMEKFLNKKIMKWNLAELIKIERVVFIPGKIKIFGGLDFAKLFDV